MAISKALTAEFKQEATNTRKLLERLPDDNLTWKPHEKSMTLGRLATHIAELPVWIERTINHNAFDFATASYKFESKENTQAILSLFDEKIATNVQLLEEASDENLNALWTLKRGEHVFFSLPRKVNIRNMAFNHIYHHRGQLSVYLRLLDIKVPGMYGPSADEK